MMPCIGRTFLVLIILSLALRPAVAASLPNVTGAYSGPPVSVFDTNTQACDAQDTPDTPARAFTDYTGTVHLFAFNSFNRAMTGPSLLNVARNCNITFNSPMDPNPAHFAQSEWLAGFYTADGHNVAALVHSEFHGDQVPGDCSAPAATAAVACWYNTVAYAQSSDGGNSFTQPPAPGNLVAAVPYQFSDGTAGTAVGFNNPTGIVPTTSGYFYAMINDWPFKAQAYGPCVIRTTNPFLPSSWRAWNGLSYATQFADPYTAGNIANPASKTCLPVGPGALGQVLSLVYHMPSNSFITTQFTPDNRWGPPGLYLSASNDLINWSKPYLVMSTATMLSAEPAGSWSYEYFSLLDPTTQDRNFAVIGNTPMIYYVRLDNLHSPYTRVLYRRPITISVY
jgi:hypothetical protein